MMKHPVQTCLEASLQSLVEFLLEVLLGFLVAFVQNKRLAQVHDGRGRQFRNTTGQHHGKEVDQMDAVAPQNHESILTA